MNEPKNHHLVPVCYLKNFGIAKHGKGKPNYFVDAYDKTREGSSVFTSNVKGVCAEKDFYTFKNLDDKQKRFLEKYFSEKIERHYTPIYKKLVNSEKFNLSEEERIIIIDFVIHQFFRTSKLTNNFNSFWTEVIKKGYYMIPPGHPKQEIQLGEDRVIDFSKKSLDEVLAEETNSNREYINASNYYRIKELSRKRKDDLISVNRVWGDHRLITSDNPVTFDGHFLDPEVFIHLPLNPTHILTIIPKSRLEPNARLFGKANMTEGYSDTISTFNNIYQIEKCERMLIGKKADLEKALLTFNNFNVDEFIEKTTKETQKLENVVKMLELMHNQASKKQNDQAI